MEGLFLRFIQSNMFLKIKIIRIVLFLSLMILFTTLSGFFAIYLGQDVNWDLRNYHYYNPYALLHNEIEDDFAPGQIQTFQNPMIDLPFYYFVNNYDAKEVTFILGFIHGINIFLLFLIALELLQDIKTIEKYILAIIVSILGFLGAGNISELGTTFGDNVVSIFFLFSFLLLIKFFKKQCINSIIKNFVIVGFAAFFSGVALGLKLTGLIYVISLFGSFVLLLLIKKHSIKYILISITCGLLGFLVTHGYWSYILYKNFQSPFFPYFNKIFKSPYYHYINFGDKRFMPRDLLQTIFYPFYFIQEQNLVSELLFRDPRLAIVYTLILISILFFLFKLFQHRLQFGNYTLFLFDKFFLQIFLLIFVICSYILWQIQFSIYRYLIVVEFLAPLVITVLLITMIKDKRFLYLPLALTFITILGLTKPLNWGRIEHRDGKFIEVNIQNNHKYENDIILITQHEPISYMIPFFPESAKVIRLEGNMDIDSLPSVVSNKIANELKDEKREIYVLIDKFPGSKKRSNKAIAPFSLMIDENTCEEVTSNIGDNELVCNTKNI